MGGLGDEFGRTSYCHLKLMCGCVWVCVGTCEDVGVGVGVGGCG